MTDYQRKQYAMLLRVRSFGNEHRDLFPDASTGAQAFADAAAAVETIETHASTTLLAARDGRQEHQAARAALIGALKTIARTARIAARQTPGTDNVFRMPAGRTDAALLTAARAFISEGQTVGDRFMPLALPATFVADLARQVDDLEQAMAAVHKGKADVMTARLGLKKALADGRNTAYRLDAIIHNVVAPDHTAVAVWKRDRRLSPVTKTAAPADAQPASPVVVEPSLKKAS